MPSVRRVAFPPRRPPIAIWFGTSGCAARCIGSGRPVFEPQSAAGPRRGLQQKIWDAGIRGRIPEAHKTRPVAARGLRMIELFRPARRHRLAGLLATTSVVALGLALAMATPSHADWTGAT